VWIWLAFSLLCIFAAGLLIFLFAYLMTKAYGERETEEILLMFVVGDIFAAERWRMDMITGECGGSGVQNRGERDILRERLQSDDGEEESGRCRHSHLQ